MKLKIKEFLKKIGTKVKGLLAKGKALFYRQPFSVAMIVITAGMIALLESLSTGITAYLFFVLPLVIMVRDVYKKEVYLKQIAELEANLVPVDAKKK